MNIIRKLLEKRGIGSVNELDDAEKQTFEQWQAVLVKEELSAGEIRDFCRNQMNSIEQKWADYNLEREKKNNLIPYHTCYRLIVAAIDSPKSARTALEQQLTQLLNT